MDSRRAAGRGVALGALILAAAACGNVRPSSSPAASPSPTPSGPTSYTSTAFHEPFTITLPAGWLVGDEERTMTSFYLPMGPGRGPRLGVDIQEVPAVAKDPCGHGPDTIDPGPSVDDLAAWMAAWAPLHASPPLATKLSGIDAISVEEAYDGAACDGPNLWRTSGGYLDPAEHKRYAILEVGGKRLVVTLVGRDDTWDATLADGEKVLDSLRFTNP